MALERRSLFPVMVLAFLLLPPVLLAGVKANGHGSLDKGFGKGGIVTTLSRSRPGETSAGSSLVLQWDGKLVVGGSGTLNKRGLALIRYRRNGSLDPSFGVGGIVNGSGAEGLVIQPDGALVAAD